MSNSPLVSYTKLSPNNSGKRTQPITKITPHHMAGNLSVETCGNVFAPASRKASSNYGIGSDGRVGMYVEEANRSWCSASNWNDQRAVTIEVANDTMAPDWTVSAEAWASLVDLCVDICNRNSGIKRADGRSGLNYTGDRNGSLTEHEMFYNTNCPGPYLHQWMQALADEVNAKIDGGETAQAPQPPAPVAPAPTVAQPAGDPWVRRLQSECNAQGFSAQAVDGIPGPNTLAGCPQLGRNSRGAITALVQERLAALGYAVGAADGINGPKTQAAIKAFQAAKGLSVDGIVGHNTWRKLLGM